MGELSFGGAIMENDWRLVNQINYLFGKKLLRRTFTEAAARDYAHCAFCWDKFSKRDGDLHCGYCTEDQYSVIEGLLANKSLDFVFVEGRIQSSHLITQTVLQDRLTAVSSPAKISGKGYRKAPEMAYFRGF